jgi:flagellar FliL protein
MSKKKKIMIGVLLALAGGGYEAYGKLMPKPVVHTKIAGVIFVLPKSFTLNLLDGRYATLTAALLLAPGQSAGAGAAGATPPPEGFGGLPEEAAIRDIITNIVTNQPGSALITDRGRERIKHLILASNKSSTDVKVSQVLFTDVAVQ